MWLPLVCNVANPSLLKLEEDDVTVHLYWPWCCGNTGLMLREFCCRVELVVITTEPSYSHVYTKCPGPITEQTNVIFPNIVAVTLLGSIVTTGGDTKVQNFVKNNFIDF